MVPSSGAALIRIAAYPKGLVLPAWPDLFHGHPDQWREWLDKTWTLPGFAAAVTCAAPQLADQIQRALSGPVPQQRLRRLVQSAVRYLLRWTTRATPFGTFAGVAPVQFGARATVRLGEAHRAVSRPDGQFIAEHTARAEQDLATLRAVVVVTNSLGYRRGDKWVLPCAHASADWRWDVEVRLTGPIRAAIQAARSPVSFAELAATIAGPASIADAERLLAELVHNGVLLSALRPPIT
ncbi:lantibiotic dehydratase, partial [Micromonospora thermarum]